MSVAHPITIQVPRDLRYTEAVENLVEIIRPLVKLGLTEKVAFGLRVTLNEAFVNAVRHSGSQTQPLLIELCTQGARLQVSVRDGGPGLRLRSHYPPYPASWVGHSEAIRTTLDGAVMGFIEDPCTVKLGFNGTKIDHLPQHVLEALAQDGGMGLSFMAKLMDDVRFRYSEEHGNSLEIVKNL